MRSRNAIWAGAGLVMVLGGARLDASELLNRSLYLPVELRLCEHLTDAVFYQEDVPVALMPVRRVFLFTYYPNLEKLLPELVHVRIEGRYKDDGETFVARLAVSPDGVFSAHRALTADVAGQAARQKHKIDIRLPEKTIVLRCPRFCKRGEAGDEANEVPERK